MTIKDLAEVQSVGVDIKVVEPDEEGKMIEKASFNSNYHNIITDEFLSQEISSMAVRKTEGQSVYIEVQTAKDDTDNTGQGGDTDPSGN